MRKGKLLLVSLSIACLGLGVISSCGKKEKEPTSQQKQTVAEPPLEKVPFYADQLLPGKVDSLHLKPIDSAHKNLYADLKAQADSLAPEYAHYNMVGQVRESYEVNGVKVTAEILQFATPEDAYGYYSQLRPDGVALGGLGLESFADGKVRYFTQGDIVVALTVEKADSAALDAQAVLGKEINTRISSPPTMPPFFMLFPIADKIGLTTKYYAHDYLGIKGLDKVYTTSYLIDGDTLVLFLTMDKSGLKFLKLQEYAQNVGKAEAAPATIPFEEFSVAFEDPQRGKVVAGLVRSKLVGAIGYERLKNGSFVSMWVKGLR